jgi:protocatechuate 3,4-dioxygenase beta subunit
MMTDDDDLPIGRILSRRDAVRLLAVGSAAALVGCKPGPQGTAGGTAGGEIAKTAAAGGGSSVGILPSCVAKPELTIGPYFLDKQLERSDIRSDPTTNAVKAGTPLLLAFRVQQIKDGQCAALPGAMVDIWQCDAAGEYSGVDDRMIGFNTVGQKFLRGYQVTDQSGMAKFLTIYPGWYQGRAVHIHFMIRTPAQAALADQSAYEFTSQLFFDESVTDRVHAQQPYAAKGQRTLKNEGDGIFRRGGDSLLLKFASADNSYDTTFDIGLDLSDAATGRSDRRGRGGPPPGGRRPPG